MRVLFKISILLLSQIIFAQDNILVETSFSIGIIFENKSVSKELGEFIPTKKEVIAFENTLQKVAAEIRAGKTEYLPEYILDVDFSKYYRNYVGLNTDRKRILVIFIPKEKINEINNSKTWEELYETKERFNISYFPEEDRIFIPAHCD